MNRSGMIGALALIAAFATVDGAEAQSIERIAPPRQRVHDFVTIHGTGFGTTQGPGRVVFQGSSGEFDAGKAYVWRDTMIKVRVPVGARIGVSNTPIDLTPLSVIVETAGGNSPGEAFQVISASGTLEFVELTDIESDRDVSTALGSPNMNLARTKDAEIGDVNADGYPDILDNNSTNVGNGTFSALHVNNQDKTFRAQAWEPRNSGDSVSGGFAATIPMGVEHFGDGVSYDADFADVDGDGYDDLIHTSTMGGGTNRVRIFLNTPSNLGRFTEATATWTPTAVFLAGQYPDDLDHADVDGNGWVDFLVTLRKRDDLVPNSITKVFFNNGSTFGSFVEVNAPAGVSTHDAFFIDAERDGDEDLFLCNESGTVSQLFVNNGSTNPYTGTPIDFSFPSNVGATADFNADGWPDFVLAKGGVKVFLNLRTDPPTFDPQPELSGAGSGQYYDVEVGDINLDGTVDIVGATLSSNSDNSVRIWLNDGSGGFSAFSIPGDPSGLPGLGDYQRLSADLLDLDRDGDLDLYVAGADGQSVGPGTTGDVPNQLYENLLQGFDIVSPTQWQSAYGGSATTGRKVLVRIRSTTPILGLGIGTFTVRVDGGTLPDTEIVVSSQIENEYWLLVRMPPKPDGCYDLEVISSVMPTLRDTEPQSICYSADRSFDRVLAIDRTGSMNYDSVSGVNTGEKMAAARAAGSIYVDLSESVDGIGVTSFQRDADDGDGVVEQHELARDDFDLRNTMAGGINQLPAARAKVAALAPDGPGFYSETSIGAGLVQAFDMLVALGDLDNERHLVLISDGRENFAPFWNDSGGSGPVMPIILGASPDVTVHTVAIGLDADIELLQGIATATGGEFQNLLEGSGSFFVLSRLADTFKLIDESMRDEQRFHYSEGIPAGLGSIWVPKALESMSVTFHWNVDYGVKTVYLLDPSGVLHQHAPPAMTMYKDAKHQAHRVVRPMPGIWQYRTASQRDPNIEFFVAASGISDLVMRKLPVDIKEEGPGVHSVALRVILADYKPLRNASVRAQITRPDKSKFFMKLYDDGAHEDGANGDGLYGARFKADRPGPFSARIQANGISSRNEPFTRIAQCGVAVSGLNPPEKPETPRDPGGQDPRDPGRVGDPNRPKDPRDPRLELRQCKKELARCLQKLQTLQGELDRSNKKQGRLEIRAKELEAIIEDLRRQLKGGGGVKPLGRAQFNIELRAIEDAVNRLKESLNANKQEK